MLNLKFLHNKRGYTWVEMVFAMAILSFAIAAVLSAYKLISRSLWQVDEKTRVQRALVFTMEQITQDLRQARTMVMLGPVNNLVLDNRSVHLDAGGVTKCAFKIPNLTDPLDPAYDATLTFFLRTMPDGSRKLYQRLYYSDGTWTQAFPAMASTDQFRLGNPVTLTIPPEPAPGGTVADPTPTPPALVYNDALGRMAGAYSDKNLSFDDVNFYYDSTNYILAVGLTLSLKSKSLSWFSSPTSRRRATLTTSIKIRQGTQ